MKISHNALMRSDRFTSILISKVAGSNAVHCEDDGPVVVEGEIPHSAS